MSGKFAKTSAHNGWHQEFYLLLKNDLIDGEQT